MRKGGHVVGCFGELFSLVGGVFILAGGGFFLVALAMSGSGGPAGGMIIWAGFNLAVWYVFWKIGTGLVSGTSGRVSGRKCTFCDDSGYHPSGAGRCPYCDGVNYR